MGVETMRAAILTVVLAVLLIAGYLFKRTAIVSYTPEVMSRNAWGVYSVCVKARFQPYVDLGVGDGRRYKLHRFLDYYELKVPLQADQVITIHAGLFSHSQRVRVVDRHVR